MTGKPHSGDSGKWFEIRHNCLTFNNLQPGEFPEFLIPEIPEMDNNTTNGPFCANPARLAGHRGGIRNLFNLPGVPGRVTWHRHTDLHASSDLFTLVKTRPAFVG